MPFQDLTPQLRTRLNHMERTVGIFVSVAVLLLLSGFVYYVYHTAMRKGWFVTKVTYFTYVDDASGLKVGDPVKLMGFDAGEITKIVPESPDSEYNVYIEFQIKSPNYGYIWFPDSRVKVTAADFLRNRYLEVTKGGSSGATNVEYRATFREEVQNGKKSITGVFQDKEGTYAPYTPESKYWLVSDESPAIAQRLEKIANQVEEALPRILGLTNQLAAVLTNATHAATNLDTLLLEARPIATNLAAITTQLRDFNGSFGRWLLSSNANQQLETTLTAAGSTMAHIDTNLVDVVEKLSLSLDNLTGITSNLNAQVQSNTNILGEISKAVVHADELVQGFKRHWLLKSAFREKSTNRPPARPRVAPTRR